ELHAGNGEEKTAGDTHTEHAIERAAGAVAIREPPAERADHAGGEAEDRRQEPRGRERDPEDVDVVRDEPLRERDEAAEDEEVVEPEPPDADRAQNPELLTERTSCDGSFHAVRRDEDEERDGRDEHQAGEHEGQAPPAVGVRTIFGESPKQGRRENGRQRRARVALAEDAERRSLALLREPGGRVRDAHGEARPREPEGERAHEEPREGLDRKSKRLTSS